MFIFPGLGLAAIIGSISNITDEQISAAAIALSENVSAEELESGLLYPSVSRMQHVSEKVAEAVLLQARKEGLTAIDSADTSQKAIDDARCCLLYTSDAADE